MYKVEQLKDTENHKKGEKYIFKRLAYRNFS